MEENRWKGKPEKKRKNRKKKGKTRRKIKTEEIGWKLKKIKRKWEKIGGKEDKPEEN